MEEKTIKVDNIQACWAVMINTDLTEGRGYDYPRFICKKQSTCVRLAKKASVQGSDGYVVPATVFIYDKKLYGPISRIESPTKEDDKEELRLQEIELKKERFAQAVYNAKQLGLSDGDLRALQENTF